MNCLYSIIIYIFYKKIYIIIYWKKMMLLGILSYFNPCLMIYV